MILKSLRLLRFLALAMLILSTPINFAHAEEGPSVDRPYWADPYYTNKPTIIPPNLPPKLPPFTENPVPESQNPGSATTNPDKEPVTGGTTPPVTLPGSGGFTPGGGGFTPGGGTQIPQIQTPAEKLPINSGTIIVEPTSGILTLTVDGAKLENLAEKAKADQKDQVSLSLLNPTGAPVNQYQAVIPINKLQDVVNLQLKLVLVAESASLSLPPALLKQISAASSKGNLNVVLADASGSDPKKTTKEAGQTLDISFWLQEAGKYREINGFSTPATLNLRFDPKTPKAKLSRLGIYRFDPTSQKWTYVGGKLNAAQGTVSVERQSFSRYSVRLYDKGFIDLVGHWARTEVETLTSLGLIKGLSELTYGPERNITRAEFAILLQRTLKLIIPKTRPYKDISGKEWYAGGIAASAQAGLIKGRTDGTFKPNDLITRQEMAVMMARALKKYKQVKVTGDPLKAFADNEKVASWASRELAQVIQAGLIKGRTKTQFAPNNNATRAEAAVMLKRLKAQIDTKK